MGGVATPFRLRAGDIGPVQQSTVSCGAACLIVARMMVDPVFASWMRTGSPHLPGSPAGASQQDRFAAYERIVMSRTNGWFAGDGRLNLPWPRRFGTAPWGARRELEYGAARLGARYAVEVLRPDDTDALVESYERLVDVVTEGEPALLYVGTTFVPRHVTLILPGDGDRMLDIYDPANGTVSHLRRDALAQRQLVLSGWNVPWFAVQPDGTRVVRARGLAGWVRSLARAPRATTT